MNEGTSLKILCLYNNDCAIPLFEWLKHEGHEVILHSKRLTEDMCRSLDVNLTVSYTYRYIVPESILKILDFNAVNLHNSYLPWNRGADPNLWSLVETAPRGVTLHCMESGVDKGAIIAQRFVPLKLDDTLRSSYDELDQVAQMQFRDAFQWYPYWQQMKKYPAGKGSYHSAQDGAALHSLIDTYDMSVGEFLRRFRQGGRP